MSVRIKSPVFIDRLTFELDHPQKCIFKAVIKDDTGIVCSAMETEIMRGPQVLDWEGLNDLPYGVYTLELTRGDYEVKMRLVKRI
jgi:hypothetical protein